MPAEDSTEGVKREPWYETGDFAVAELLSRWLPAGSLADIVQGVWPYVSLIQSQEGAAIHRPRNPRGTDLLLDYWTSFNPNEVVEVQTLDRASPTFFKRCDPHGPGSNENTSRLSTCRRGTNLSVVVVGVYSAEDLASLASSLNNRSARL